MRHITLLTDFGTTEGEHTVLKGVIWRILPRASIADLSHDISPQNILEGALVLERTAHFFPEETVHIVVIDPGVGTHRRPIAARCGDQFFVGPDNGICTPMLERAERLDFPIEIVHLDNPKFWLEDVTSIFHRRDIFAPCGGHLSAGVALIDLGTPITDVIRIKKPDVTITEAGIQGEVMHIDRYGNLICNIRREDIQNLGQVKVKYKDIELGKLVNTFGDKNAGEICLLYSPMYYLMIAETNGNAQNHLNAKRGDKVEVYKI